MSKIKLGKEVMISDPCYVEPTWCQHKLKNVLPGEYSVYNKYFNAGNWGIRNSMLIAVHQDYEMVDNLRWKECTGAVVGVDSGQAGIFDHAYYRKDSVFENQESKFLKEYVVHNNEGGEIWYAHMCDRTLGEEGWGHFEHGVVSRSGFGDGSYTLYVARINRKVVGICIDFEVEPDGTTIEFDFYKNQAV
jgi:hypothetical protein